MAELDELRQDIASLSLKLDRLADQMQRVTYDLGVDRDYTTAYRLAHIETELTRYISQFENNDIKKLYNNCDLLQKTLYGISQNLEYVKNQIQAEQLLSRDIQKSLTVISSRPAITSVSGY